MLAGYCYDLCDDVIAVVVGFGLKTRPLGGRRFLLEGFDAYGRQRLHDCGVSRVACDIGRSGGGMPATEIEPNDGKSDSAGNGRSRLR